MGDLYFEVSRHLGKPVSWVIKNKFTPDVKFLILKYAYINRKRREEYEHMRENLNGV